MSLKLMVVDDDPTVPRLLQSLAASSGYMTLPFADYQAAGQRAEVQRIDVAFVGLRQSEPHGIELARRIRQSELNRETILIMLSSAADLASQRNAFGEGADLFLIKPIPADSLRRMLAAFPEWKHQRPRARLPLSTDVLCTQDDRKFIVHSLNISESGMLLQPALEAEVGQVIGLEFKIKEVCASLDVLGRIVRSEGTERMAIEFVRLSTEDQNAIHLYITGHQKDISGRQSPEFEWPWNPARMT